MFRWQVSNQHQGSPGICQTDGKEEDQPVDKDFKGVHEILVAEYDWTDGDEFIPSMPEFQRFRKWVLWADGLDPDNRLIGFCPLHDRSRRTEGSAVFDFVKGMMWCQASPSCHAGRRAMSLTNLYVEVASRSLA